MVGGEGSVADDGNQVNGPREYHDTCLAADDNSWSHQMREHGYRDNPPHNESRTLKVSHWSCLHRKQSERFPGNRR